MEATARSCQDRPASHPPGLYYLSFTELWERFSFYGMSALLTLYLVKDALIPAHAAQVAGLETLRDLIEFRGPISDIAFAAIIYGWYSGLVYFTPILGGWIADRILGAKRTVMLGIVLMSAGHLAMSFYSTLLIALALLVVGSGFLKGNISAQVGALYPEADETMRSRGFTMLSTGICVGAAIGPIVTGLVAAVYGWHAGFAVAATLMLVALGTYLAGQRHLPDDRPAASKRDMHPPLSPPERKRVGALLVVVLLTVPAEIAYPMVWSIGILWVDHYVNLATPLGDVPSSWFASMDSIGAILAAPALVWLWARQAQRGCEPTGIAKLSVGSILIAIGALLFALGSIGQTQPDSVGAGWAIAGWLVMGVAWMHYWPTTLAIVSKSAPPAMTSTLLGVAFLSPFVGHVLAGWIGSYFDQMEPSAFWALDAAIAGAGAAIILLLRKPLQRSLDC